jgi:hypothetical protein
MQPSIEQFLMQLPPPKRELALQIRETILSVNPEIEEAIKWGQLAFLIKKKYFVFIYTYKHLDYLNLGFKQAIKLSDPKNLFEGTGKGMRHIKVSTAKDIPATQIKKWVKEAIQVEMMSATEKSLNKKAKVL